MEQIRRLLEKIMIRFKLKIIALSFSLLLTSVAPSLSAGAGGELLKVEWSFKGLTGKFDRASLQRGFQVYKEVCSSCHSMQYLSYRNLGEPGGPEFSELEVKAIAASVEIEDGPDSQGEMFTRPEDHLISSKVHILMLMPLLLLTVEHIRQICRY